MPHSNVMLLMPLGANGPTQLQCNIWFGMGAGLIRLHPVRQ
jgi:hypothetical protein